MTRNIDRLLFVALVALILAVSGTTTLKKFILLSL